MSGTAHANWVGEVQRKALLVPGIRAVELAPGLEPEQLAFTQAKTEIETAIVRFPLASATLSSQERTELQKLAESVRSLLKASNNLHENAALEVLGHTDSTGAEASNLNLSQRRAERVAWELGQMGIPERILQIRGMGTTNPLRHEDTEDNRQFNRSVNFHVVVVTH